MNRDRPGTVMGTSWSARILLVITAVLSLLAFCWPLFLNPGSIADYHTRAPLLFAVILPVALVVVVSQMSADGIDVKALAMLGVLTACGAGLRPLGAGTAGIEMVFFTIMLGGRVFGPAFGFVLGTTTLFTSAIITAGFGPWLPYQMLAAAFVGMGAGLLPRRLRSWSETLVLAVYGALASFLYGWLMDFAFWPFNLGMDSQLSFNPAASIGTNLWHFVLFNAATSMGWNLGRAVTNVILVVLAGQAVMQVLRRAARKANWHSSDDAWGPGSVPYEAVCPGEEETFLLNQE
ncbi:MAG: ECF transporter S component [Cutibacterium granulosum]|uniref:ECF transporter S component n=1 Tax=Cutibacterium granulosum TaxID=33011 RepID=UPI002B22E319|nr:ECF transporter S component [Cutibacterium granulosum]MBS5253624.1 ECF transporter S component [Cutibacterium granulosum]MEA5649544.1 ECF transporter S component [Cutibacterium granulosum]MEA5654844.1 ECF transporter S component [Cutibacterium granulosum]MEA5662963.1 ECF transporter S component [Cutibacterium granulosum]MEA5665283.1 ECF transporter S component [Cutibacterium granulosum]